MEIAISLIVLIVSIIAHEVAHGYAADALGDPTARYAGRLTLNPVPHIDLLGSLFIPGFLMFSGSPILFGWAKPVPYNPYNLKNQRWGLPAQAGEALVAVAGSATNLLLALIFALVVRFGVGTLPETALMIAGTIAFVNLFLGLFNLIPFPPLDGFTALLRALPWRASRGLEHFEAKVRSAGPMALILFLLVFSFVLARPFFTFISWLFRALTGTI